MRRADVATLGDLVNGSTSPKATGADETAVEVGWPTSTCVVGIVLKHPSP
jgi:hypothetical protein